MESTPIGSARPIAPMPQIQEAILHRLKELVPVRANDIYTHGSFFLLQQDLVERLAEIQAINAQGHRKSWMTKMREGDPEAYLKSFECPASAAG